MTVFSHVKKGSRWAAAALVPLALVVGACGGGDDATTDTVATTAAPVTTASPATTADSPTTTAAPKPREVIIQPLSVRGDGGEVSEETISMEPSPDGSLRVEFSEDEVGGLGDASRAASWSAVTVATLLSGSPLEGEFQFRRSGFIDGPSAGALKTVAVLSLVYGDTLDRGTTMTGTINPDGTVGPVGGIPEKVAAAAEEGLELVLIPVGQRNSTDHDGQLVDVVDLGRRAGLEVREVDDVYDAYEAFTGEALPRLEGGADARLDERSYSRLQAQADAFMASYQQSAGVFGSLDPTIQELLTDLMLEAEGQAERAASLSRQGLQAGAFSAAVQAAALADAAAVSGQGVQILLTQGIDPFLARIESSRAIEGEVYALFDTLKTFEPRTVSDAASLMSAYAVALDSLSVSTFGSDELATIASQIRSGEMTLDEAMPQLLIPAVMYEVAGTGVDMAKAIFEVGRDLGGPTIEPDVDVAKAADFFRKGSDANFAAFQSTVVVELGNRYGRSEDATLAAFMNRDTDVALTVTQRNVLEGLKSYIGEGEPNAEYAQLGFAISNYARNALLLEKYYSNGQVDADLSLTGVRSEAALIAGLELGKDQLAAGIGLLRGNEVEPAIQVAQFEMASVQREGDVGAKFDALSSYWSGFVGSRVLAYLGGFATDGLAEA
jgi:hypothetical protein